MAEEASKTIEITEFVPLAKVDPIYFEGAYYLGPDKGGEKAYRLLSEAMRQTGRCALAKWAARGKQYLTLMRPVENGIIMQVLHYADEVRPFRRSPSVTRRSGSRSSSWPAAHRTDRDGRVQARATWTTSARGTTKPSSARWKTGSQPRRPGPRRAGSSTSWKRSRRAWPRRPRAVPAAGSAPRRRPAKRAAAARATEARTLRAPKAAAGGKRR